MLQLNLSSNDNSEVIFSRSNLIEGASPILYNLFSVTESNIRMFLYSEISDSLINRHDFKKIPEFQFLIMRNLEILQSISHEKHHAYIKDCFSIVNEIVKFNRETENYFEENDKNLIAIMKIIRPKKGETVSKNFKPNLRYACDLCEMKKDDDVLYLSLYNSFKKTLEGPNSSNNPEDFKEGKWFKIQLDEHVSYISSNLLKKQDYNDKILDLLSKLKAYIELIADEYELKEAFQNNPSFLPSEDIVELIASKIVSNRPFNVIEFSAHDGSYLKPFIDSSDDNLKLANNFYVGFIEESHHAKHLGVENIAKGGIERITHNSMDIVFNFVSDFYFLASKRTFLMNPNPSNYYIGQNFLLDGIDKNENYFARMLSSNIPRQDGYIFINIPRACCNAFHKFLTKQFTILGAYSLNDALDQILFVLRYQKTENKFSKLFIDISRKRNPNIEDMEPIVIQNSFKEIEVFRPNVFELSDLEEMIDESNSNTLDLIEKAFVPEDEIQSLTNPLQEPKPGHLAAIASTQVINGIYHNQDINSVCIFSTKLVRQEAVETSFAEDGTRIEKYVKRNNIVAEATYPDGRLVTLLNTDSISDDAKSSDDEEEEV